MKNEKDNVTPLFINGEFNDRVKRNRPTMNNNGNEKLPTKRYGFSDFLLTLIGVALVGYGIYMFMNKDNTKKEDSNSNSAVKEEKKSNSNSNKEKKETIDYDKLVSFTETSEKKLFTSSDLKLLSTGLETSMMSNNLKLSLAARITEKHLFDNDTNAYILGSDLDNKMKLLFGETNYSKSAFYIGFNNFTYNQETNRFYLYQNIQTSNLNYKRYNYVVKEEKDNTLIVKDYVAYTTLDKTKSSTLNNTKLTTIITDDNIKDEISNLKYLEYEFVLEDGSYHLKKITLK